MIRVLIKDNKIVQIIDGRYVKTEELDSPVPEIEWFTAIEQHKKPNKKYIAEREHDLVIDTEDFFMSDVIAYEDGELVLISRREAE